MLPNRFPDRGEQPEFNSVDASLWYVVAVGELLQAADAAEGSSAAWLSESQRRTLRADVGGIVTGYARGTRFGIRMDADGLLSAGVPGVQLTWMDARVGERVITPRIGKPVEIQALWYNAVAVAGRTDATWRALLPRIRRSFAARFWDDAAGMLADVVDVGHVAGQRDLSLRPNQVLAVGGLPLPLLGGRRARKVVDRLESELLTPNGLRSLAPGDPSYVPHYQGGPGERDAAYHQGTVWPWLMGPFVEGWLRVRGNSERARAEARRRFFDPMSAHLRTAGLGHVSEITDAEPPFTPAGCPFQAWSLGEYLRLDRLLGSDLESAHFSRSGTRQVGSSDLVHSVARSHPGARS